MIPIYPFLNILTLILPSLHCLWVSYWSPILSNSILVLNYQLIFFDQSIYNLSIFFLPFSGIINDQRMITGFFNVNCAVGLTNLESLFADLFFWVFSWYWLINLGSRRLINSSKGFIEIFGERGPWIVNWLRNFIRMGPRFLR